MPEVEVRGQYQLRLLSARLREAGSEGQGLRHAMYQKMNDAVKPLAKQIADPEHLREYLPDPYADILAGDLSVRISKHFSKNPSIEVRAKSRQHQRRVQLLDSGFINHPVWARGPRRGWNWSNRQTGGMRAGFFTDACKEASPEIRDKVLAAMTETARMITGK